MEITTKEFLSKIKTVKINESKIRQIEKIYGSIPKEVQKIISSSSRTIFFSNKDGYRTLSISEIIDAEKDMQINFVKEKMIPIIDCSDNDFIVFHTDTKTWSKYNVDDDRIYKETHKFEDLLK